MRGLFVNTCIRLCIVLACLYGILYCIIIPDRFLKWSLSVAVSIISILVRISESQDPWRILRDLRLCSSLGSRYITLYKKNSDLVTCSYRVEM